MDWSSIPSGKEDAIYKVKRLHTESTHPQKINVGIGAYRDDEGRPLVLEAVVRAKAQLASLPTQEWTHEYLPIMGHSPFLTASQDLLLTPELRSDLGTKLVSIQSISGSGANRLAFDLHHKFGTNNVLYVPNPTWGNHKSIAKMANLEIREYTYLDTTKPNTPLLDGEGMVQDLSEAEEGSMVVLHMCAHNPTGVDPTLDQWDRIAQVCKDRNLQPFFDNAYQGFASGSLHNDAASLRLFLQPKYNLHPLVACSFAKNMGLYGERVGALHVMAPNEETAQATLSQLKIIARSTYSTPPQFGALIAHRVMTNVELRTLWENELRSMSERIQSMRKKLRAGLEERVPEQSWVHITNQIGMFSYTGLTPEQAEYCGKEGALFMLSTGRVSMAGLNEGNVDRAAEVMADSIKANPVKDKKKHLERWASAV